MFEKRVPVLLLLVAAHGQHQSHGVVDTLYAAIRAGVVRAGVDLVDAKALVEGVGEFGCEVQAVIGDEREGALPMRNVLVDEDIDGAGGGELAGRLPPRTCRHGG